MQLPRFVSSIDKLPGQHREFAQKNLQQRLFQRLMMIAPDLPDDVIDGILTATLRGHAIDWAVVNGADLGDAEIDAALGVAIDSNPYANGILAKQNAELQSRLRQQVLSEMKPSDRINKSRDGSLDAHIAQRVEELSEGIRIRFG